MPKQSRITAIMSLLVCIHAAAGADNRLYSWLEEYKSENSIEKRINTPEGYERIRLRAEYLFSQKRYKDICFNFTSGHKAEFSKWTWGYRPQVRGNSVRWSKTGSKGRAYSNLQSYLETVFIYAGSASLDKELYKVINPTWMQIGDVFIKGGFPGHAVIVADMARHVQTGELIFLCAQSYMPAQDMHILINPMDTSLSPWFKLDISKDLKTPEWTFKWNQLKRFEKVKKPGDTRRSASLTGTFRSLKSLPGPILGYIVTFDVVHAASRTFNPKTVTFATYHYYGGQDLVYALGYNVGDGFSRLPDKPIDKTKQFTLVVRYPPQKVSLPVIKKYGINADLVIWKVKK